MSAAGYNANNPEAYELFMGRWTRRLADAIVARIQLPSGPRLDVGCGTGAMAAALRAHSSQHHIVGVDVSEAYLEHARARADNSGVEFHCMDAQEMGVDDDSFASSLSIIALNFMAEPDIAVSEMVRATKPGGMVLGAVWDFRGGLMYQRLLWDSAALLDPRAAEMRDKLFSNPLALPNGLTTACTAAGLTDVVRHSVTIRMDFADFDDYWLPMLGGQGPVAGYVAALSGDMREQVETAVRAAYLSGDVDGPRSLTATAWVVQGTKP